MTRKTETNVETITVKAIDMLAIQSVTGPNKITAVKFMYNNKILNVLGTLDQILQLNATYTAYAIYALPSNVTGCSAEYRDDLGWVGCLGSFASMDEFQAAVPSTSAIGYDQAWALIAGTVYNIKSGFVLSNAGTPKTSDASSYAFDKSVLSANSLRHSGAQRLKGSVAIASWGSSSTSQGLTTMILAGAATQADEGCAGYIYGVQTQLGADFDYIWNGGVSGTVSSQILTQLKTDWPTVGPLIDVAILQLAANDLPTAYDFSTFIPKCVEAVEFVLRAGKRVVLVIPHTPNVCPVSHTRYTDFEAWALALQASRSEYPGQIMIANHYRQISNGIDTPLELLASPGSPALHLNAAGAAAVAQAWTHIVASLTNTAVAWSDPTAYGSITKTFDFTNATLTSATKTADSNSADGRAQWIITATSSLGRINDAVAATLDTAKQYRMFADYDVLTSPVSLGYMDGVKLSTSGASPRLGVYPVAGGSTAPYCVRAVPVRVRTLSRRFTPAATTGTLQFFPGDIGGSCRVRSIALLQAT